jgi:hypothetical protein
MSMETITMNTKILVRILYFHWVPETRRYKKDAMYAAKTKRSIFFVLLFYKKYWFNVT